MCASSSTADDSNALLSAILAELKDVKANQATFEQKLEALALPPTSPRILTGLASSSFTSLPTLSSLPAPVITNGTATPPFVSKPLEAPTSPSLVARKDAAGNGYSQRVILTTYPGQVGVHPIPLKWGAETPEERGPVVASRQPLSLKVRNALGAYGGSYSIYRALAAACGQIDPSHRPDYTNTEPPVEIPHNPSWDGVSKIVSLDPYGHLVPQLFKAHLDAGIDIRPTIAITKAHIKLIDMDAAVKAGTFNMDGKIVVKTPTDEGEADAGVELNVSKAAVEPVWYLPGIAARFGITEGALRRSLFEDTGGMYPELLTRHDLKTFLPPIGGLTVYIFGPPEYLRDPTKELTLRVHDECNGSDVFGSDICTCRPYLIFGMEEAVRCAQRGGVGCVVYFRKEGRALGEVTKYLVYNARKRGGDSASKYFAHTEQIAGVKDMRFQALMPDVLHWLGIQKIDNMISMSDMKYDAIVSSGIPIHKRYEIPDELIPKDGRVEIDAKIAAGYYSAAGNVIDLSKTAGRLWEDLEH
jgi:GTP cyclohydrolase II